MRDLSHNKNGRLTMKCLKQNRLWINFLFILLFLIHFTNVNADTLYVGPGETYTTISDAVTASVAGDTIIVKDGTYNEIVTVDKSLIIYAENQHQAILATGMRLSDLW